MASFKTIYTMQEQAGRDYWVVGLGVPVDGKVLPFKNQADCF
jgi:hypothetical protein